MKENETKNYIIRFSSIDFEKKSFEKFLKNNEIMYVSLSPNLLKSLLVEIDINFCYWMVNIPNSINIEEIEFPFNVEVLIFNHKILKCNVKKKKDPIELFLESWKSSYIIQNALYIPEKDNFLVSKSRYDLVTDGEYSVDGGLDYSKIKAPESGKDIFRYVLTTESKIEVIKERLLWGSSLDKDGNRLDKTIWRPISQLETSHILNILKQTNISELHKIVAIEILQDRFSKFEKNETGNN